MPAKASELTWHMLTGGRWVFGTARLQPTAAAGPAASAAASKNLGVCAFDRELAALCRGCLGPARCARLATPPPPMRVACCVSVFPGPLASRFFLPAGALTLDHLCWAVGEGERVNGAVDVVVSWSSCLRAHPGAVPLAIAAAAVRQMGLVDSAGQRALPCDPAAQRN